jgi:hypothetical protein
MTATATGIEPLEHAKSQFGYAVPVIVGTLVSFFVVGLLYDKGLYRSFLTSMIAGMGIMIALFVAFNYGKSKVK